MKPGSRSSVFFPHYWLFEVLGTRTRQPAALGGCLA